MFYNNKICTLGTVEGRSKQTPVDLRPVWPTREAPDQSWLFSEILSKKVEEKKKCTQDGLYPARLKLIFLN